MPKAKSLTGRTEIVRRWKIRVDGQVEDFNGHVYKELPLEIAYSPQAVELARQGKLEIAGLHTPMTPDKPKVHRLEPTGEEEKTTPPPIEFNKKRPKGK